MSSRILHPSSLYSLLRVSASHTTHTSDVTDEPSTPVAQAPKKMAYWGSPTLRIRDMNGKILEVNSEKPAPYESEYFKGVILTMVHCEGGRYEKHFTGKQRKFEVQIQVSSSSSSL
jgi:hypothetical protein